MHLFLFTNTAQRELVSICGRAYVTAINFPCICTLVKTKKNVNLKPTFHLYLFVRKYFNFIYGFNSLFFLIKRRNSFHKFTWKQNSLSPVWWYQGYSVHWTPSSYTDGQTTGSGTQTFISWIQIYKPSFLEVKFINLYINSLLSFVLTYKK